MKMPFVMDITKVKKNIGMIYLAVMLTLVVNGASFVLPSDITRYFVPILAILIGYICGRSQYDMTGSYGASILTGIFAAFTLINIFIVMYILIKNKRVISEFERRTSSI